MTYQEIITQLAQISPQSSQSIYIMLYTYTLIRDNSTIRLQQLNG